MYYASIFIFSILSLAIITRLSVSVRSVTMSFSRSRFYRSRLRTGRVYLTIPTRTNSLCYHLGRHVIHYVNNSRFADVISVLPRHRGVIRLKQVVYFVCKARDLDISEKRSKLLLKYLEIEGADFLERALLPYAVIGAVAKILSRYNYGIFDSDRRRRRYYEVVSRAQKILRSDLFFTKEYYKLQEYAHSMAKNKENYHTESGKILSQIGGINLTSCAEFVPPKELICAELPSEVLSGTQSQDGVYEIQIFGKTVLKAPPNPYHCEWVEVGDKSYEYADVCHTGATPQFIAGPCKKSVFNFANRIVAIYRTDTPVRVCLSLLFPRDASCDLAENQLIVNGKNRCVFTLYGGRWCDVKIEDGAEAVLRASFSCTGGSILTFHTDDSILCRQTAHNASAYTARLRNADCWQKGVMPAEVKTIEQNIEVYKGQLTFHSFCENLPIPVQGYDECEIMVNANAVKGSYFKGALIVQFCQEFRPLFGTKQHVSIIRLDGNCLIGIPIGKEYALKTGRLVSEEKEFRILGVKKACFARKKIWLQPQGRALVINGQRGTRHDEFNMKTPPRCPFKINDDLTECELEKHWQNAFGIGRPDLFEMVCLARLTAYCNRLSVNDFLRVFLQSAEYITEFERLLLMSLDVWQSATFGGELVFGIQEIKRNIMGLACREKLDEKCGVLLAYCIHGLLGMAGDEEDRLTMVEALEDVIARYGFEYADVMDFRRTWLSRVALMQDNRLSTSATAAISFDCVITDGLGLEFSGGMLRIGTPKIDIQGAEIHYSGGGFDLSISYRQSDVESMIVDGIKRSGREVAPVGSRNILVCYMPFRNK